MECRYCKKGSTRLYLRSPKGHGASSCPACGKALAPNPWLDVFFSCIGITVATTAPMVALIYQSWSILIIGIVMGLFITGVPTLVFELMNKKNQKESVS